MEHLKGFLKYAIIAVIVAGCLIFLNNWYNDVNPSVDMANVELVQLDAINQKIDEGRQIAIIDTSLGEMKAVLYPEYAPNTVSNFVNLAESGYYDGTYIFRVEKGIYFAGGSPNADGTIDSEAAKQDNEKIKNEYNDNLWPFRGAIFSMSATDGYGGSRFMVGNSIVFDDETKEEIMKVDEDTRLAEAFIEYGGIPNFSHQLTVFAQIYDGLDTLDKITAVEVSDDDNKYPKEDIIIKSIKISTYSQKTSE